MLLRDELKAYDNTEDRLEGFKKAIILQFNRYRSKESKLVEFDLLQQGKEYPELALSQDDDYQYENEEVSLALVDEILIELGLSDKQLKIHEKHVVDYDCLIFYYSLSEFWNLLINLSDYDFFVAMIFLLHKEEKRKSIKKLRDIVIGEINRFDIKYMEIKNKKVFIAMSFDPLMKPVRDVIQEVVRGFKLDPILIDEKEHNNQIVPEMIMEIEQSVVLIADLTQHKQGVYYEAGYAHAKGKEVIFSCRDSEYENRHFDISHINTIKWEDFIDLEEKLNKRLKATLYKIKNDHTTNFNLISNESNTLFS